MVPAPVRAASRALSVTVPPLAAEVGARLFTRVGPPARVRSIDTDVHAAARRGTVDVDGTRVATYTWDDGAAPGSPAVLLVHGWQLRASRFGFLVRALTAAGWRVESYDAPGHGDSAGDRLTLPQHVAAMRAVAAVSGPFDAVVGHSLGAFAAGTALHDGFPAHRFVSLAGPTGFESVVSSYLRLTGMSPALHERLARRIVAVAFPDDPAARERFDLRRHPVPGHVPTLFVQDDADAVHDVGEGRALHAAHPGSELLVTSGLGHNRVMDDDATVRAVVAHLAPVHA